MKNDDVKLIQRVLSGDDTAFSTLVKKYQKIGSRARVAENRRFPHRRRYHPRYLPKSIPETGDPKGTTVFCELALCDSDEPLQDMAP